MSRLGEKVLILLNSGAPFTFDASEGTCAPKPVVADLNLQLESAGLNAADAPLQLTNFVQKDGSVKLSVIMLLREIPKSIAINVARVIFECILEEAPVQSPSFTVIVAGAVPIPGCCQQNTGANIRHEDISLDGVQIQLAELNGCSEGGIFHKLSKLPPSLELRDEFLACLLHVARVLNLPTALLLGPGSREPRSDEKARSDLGAILAKQLGINFGSPVKQGLFRADNTDWRTCYI